MLASMKWGLFSRKFPLNLVFYYSVVESLAECGVGWRLSLCKYINLSTTLEAIIQCQADNEFALQILNQCIYFSQKVETCLFLSGEQD